MGFALNRNSHRADCFCAFTLLFPALFALLSPLAQAQSSHVLTTVKPFPLLRKSSSVPSLKSKT